MPTPDIYVRINENDDMVVTTVEPPRVDRNKLNLFTIFGAVLLAGVAFSLLTEN